MRRPSTKRRPVVTIGAIGPSGPSAFGEAPAGLRLKLSTSTQGSMLLSCQGVFFFFGDLREIPFPFPSILSVV